MNDSGVFEKLSHVQRRAIAALVVFVLFVHGGLLVYEVTTTANNLYQMLFKQVSNFTSMNVQTGDLISLQQNLESISAPVADSFPIEVRIFRSSDQKLFVSTTSAQFNSKSWFLYRSESDFAAMPFGQMTLVASFDYSNLVFSIFMKAIVSMTLLLGGLLVAQSFVLRATKASLVPIDQFSFWLSRLDPDAVRRGSVGIPPEAKNSGALSGGLERLFIQINALAKEVATRESGLKMAEIASQVSHDIRSPLSALNMVTASIKDMPEEKRLMIRSAVQRINDIANALLQQSKRPREGSTSLFHAGAAGTTTADPVMLVALLDSIISEKRVQFRERMEVEIQGDLNQGYGLFANINTAEFARVVSNLVNNSVEAFTGPGKVTIKICENENFVVVTVSDNGKGIPPDVLARLGARGVTHGKDGSQSGSGLGVFHARQTIEQAGGQVSIRSQIGLGTKISITLPRAEAPKWFVEKLVIPFGTVVVSSDDDQTIHQIWSERLTSAGSVEAQIQHLTFSSLEQFEGWVSANRSAAAIYFVDYEFLGQVGNGLESIERLSISKNVILVTSRYEEHHVREHAERIGVRILPKTLAPFVPLQILPMRTLPKLSS